jgi:hypothetical protein
MMFWEGEGEREEAEEMAGELEHLFAASAQYL